MNELLFKIEHFTFNLIAFEIFDDFSYHNLEQTALVVEGAIAIGKTESLTDA